MSRYRFLDQYRAAVPVREVCPVLRMAPGRYYAWWQRCQQFAPALERAVVRAS